ncbi:MAG: hypothetical protein AAF517_18420 [Planctomycetota bacterium]
MNPSHVVLGAIFPLILQLALLYWIARQLSRAEVRIHRRWFYLNAAFGTSVHETGHAIACLITGTRIHEFRPFSPRPDGTLGWVTHSKTGRFRMAVISIAPLFGNAAAILLLCQVVFGSIAAHLVETPTLSLQGTDGTGDVFVRLADFLRDYFVYFVNGLGALPFDDWRTYVFLFLATSAAAHAAPSHVDLKHFFAAMIPVLLGAAVFVWILSFTPPESWGGATARGIAFAMDRLTAMVSLSVVFTTIAWGINAGLLAVKRAFTR